MPKVRILLCIRTTCISCSPIDGFIAGAEGDEEEVEVHRRAADHARLDRRREELNEQDLAQIAADVSERYRRTAVRYSGDMNEIPQRLLMPSVHDANLWQVRVKVSIIPCFVYVPTYNIVHSPVKSVT